MTLLMRDQENLEKGREQGIFGMVSALRDLKYWKLYLRKELYVKVLLINCSPVRNGAIAEIVKIVQSCLQVRHDIKCICIDDFDIKFCKGCRTCHKTAKCVQNDDVIKIMEQYEWADIIISVSPSYWADIPGQFKAFIDRCTPWCNTHEPHAAIGNGKKGYCLQYQTSL